jgi:hypothetical protein
VGSGLGKAGKFMGRTVTENLKLELIDGRRQCLPNFFHFFPARKTTTTKNNKLSDMPQPTPTLGSQSNLKCLFIKTVD